MGHALATEAVTSQGTACWSEHMSGEVWSGMMPHGAEENTRTFSCFNSPKLAAGLAALGRFFPAVLFGTSLGIMPDPLNLLSCRPVEDALITTQFPPVNYLDIVRSWLFPSGFVFHCTLCDGISVHDQQLCRNVKLAE